jgi:predicted TIM-barrel fold metal-dependent hydrolase
MECEMSRAILRVLCVAFVLAVGVAGGAWGESPGERGEGANDKDGGVAAEQPVLPGEGGELIRPGNKAAEAVPATRPTDLMFIDVHVHAHPCRPGGLDIVDDWMKRARVDRCIISPLEHKGSRDYTPEDRAIMLANFAKYKGRMDRMCIIPSGEVETVDEAVKILRQEMADGAIAFGEHYGVGLMFDDPKNLLLYEACEKVGLPVMFHIDQHRNKVEKGMERVDHVLRKFPKCTLIAHAYWWRQLKDADRQLQQYPNLYADLSGAVVPAVLGRDPAYAREFVIRNQDKLLFGTDEGWWSFGKDPSKSSHYTFLEAMDLPKAVRYKVYRGNAERLFGWKAEGKP